MSVKNEIKISFDARAFEATEHEHVKEILDNLESKKSENENYCDEIERLKQFPCKTKNKAKGRECVELLYEATFALSGNFGIKVKKSYWINNIKYQLLQSIHLLPTRYALVVSRLFLLYLQETLKLCETLSQPMIDFICKQTAFFDAKSTVWTMQECYFGIVVPDPKTGQVDQKGREEAFNTVVSIMKYTYDAMQDLLQDKPIRMLDFQYLALKYAFIAEDFNWTIKARRLITEGLEINWNLLAIKNLLMLLDQRQEKGQDLWLRYAVCVLYQEQKGKKEDSKLESMITKDYLILKVDQELAIHVNVAECNKQLLEQEIRASVSEEDLQKFKDTFKQFDKGTGHLHQDSFKACLKALGFELPVVRADDGAEDEREFEGYLDAVDPNREDKISLQDYMAFMISKSTEPIRKSKEIESAFRAITQDRDYITASELKGNLSTKMADYCMKEMKCFGFLGTGDAKENLYDFPEFIRRILSK